MTWKLLYIHLVLIVAQCDTAALSISVEMLQLDIVKSY